VGVWNSEKREKEDLTIYYSPFRIPNSFMIPVFPPGRRPYGPEANLGEATKIAYNPMRYQRSRKNRKG